MGALDLPEQSREIGGLVYRVQPLTVRKSLQVMTRVLRMAGPGFGDVAALEDAADKMGALIGAASVLSGELDEAVLLFLCESFAEVSKVDLAPAKVLPLGTQFDDHFRGNLPDLFEWLKFAVEVTYGPLVPWLRGIAAKAKAEAEAEAKHAADAAKVAAPQAPAL